MNLILEDCAQVPYFTNMRVVFDAVELNASDFDWFVSDIEHTGDDAFCSEDHWISGEDLERALLSNDIQFVWAVFSVIPKGDPRPVIHEPPYADGNPAFWSDPSPRPQLIGHSLKSCAGIAVPPFWWGFQTQPCAGFAIDSQIQGR